MHDDDDDADTDTHIRQSSGAVHSEAGLTLAIFWSYKDNQHKAQISSTLYY